MELKGAVGESEASRVHRGIHSMELKVDISVLVATVVSREGNPFNGIERS